MLLPTQWATDMKLELELKSILDEGKSLSRAAGLLIEAIESGDKAKRQTAVRFLQLHPEWKYWKKDFEPWLQSLGAWPWDLLLHWLNHQRLLFSLEDREALKAAFVKQKVIYQVVRYGDWGVMLENIKDVRSQARLDIQKRILEVRDLLLEELRTWKSQRLREQEFKVIKRLRKKFPNDPDIALEEEKLKQNQAFEVLGNKLREKKTGPKTKELRFKEEVTHLSEEIEKQLLDFVDQNPHEAYDLAIACCFIEDWVTALHLINRAVPSVQRDWLELEILLNLKRFVDVMQALQVIELRWSQDPETFFATAYCRAQALYGLGQKEKALEVMESLLASRPLYRQGVELLHIWKGSQA